ncbi:MAG: hypothetical protein ACOY71_04465 [Gemmatimonadota bacterium]
MMLPLLAVLAGCGGEAGRVASPTAGGISAAAVTVTPAHADLLPGASQQFLATSLSATGIRLDLPVRWAATGGAVTGAGLYTAGSQPGAYQVTATVPVNLSARASVSVVDTAIAPPPPPPPASGPSHEPSGFTPITHRAFNDKAQAPGDRSKPDLYPMWDDIEYRYGHIYTVADASGPLSSGSVMRFFYPAQTVAAGTTFSPGPVQTFSFKAKQFTKLYVRYAVRLSPNFQGHNGSTTNKLVFHRGINSTGKVFEPIIRFRGAGSGPLLISVDPQGMADNNTPIPTGPAVSRGQWHIIEGLFEIGTPGASNGRITIWLDGQQVIDVNNREFAWGQQGYWDYVHINPTWGGQGGTITQDMWIDVDDAYISGAP